MTPDDRPLPLSGIRVLDLSNLLAGPMTGMYLGDFGADVIKVEHPERGDEFREWGFAKDGVGLFFKLLNRNKRMITLNLSTPRGQELVRELAQDVDVVIENYRPGTLERWGIGYEQLRAVNPGLVMARITGFGQTGPYSARAGFGTIAEAFTGFAASVGTEDTPPLLPPFGLADGSTATHAALGIMVALYHRDVHGGEGQFIDLALYDGLFTLLGPHVVDYDQLGVVPGRIGSRSPFVAPRNTYRTSDDQWIAIAGCTQVTFERLVRTLGIEHVLEDEDLADNRGRLAHNDKLDAIIANAVAQRPLAELVAVLADAGAPVGPVNSIDRILEDPHYAARGSVVTVADDQLGPMRMQGVVPRLAGTPGRIDHAGRPKGSDTDEVLRERLGLSDGELEVLHATAVV